MIQKLTIFENFDPKIFYEWKHFFSGRTFPRMHKKANIDVFTVLIDQLNESLKASFTTNFGFFKKSFLNEIWCVEKILIQVLTRCGNSIQTLTRSKFFVWKSEALWKSWFEIWLFSNFSIQWMFLFQKQRSQKQAFHGSGKAPNYTFLKCKLTKK